MLTRPAAAFMQILGAFVALFGLISTLGQGWGGVPVLLAGVLMVWWGGRDARRRMKA